MKQTHRLVRGAACLLLALALAVPAAAHGCHGGRGRGVRQAPAGVTVCTVEGCDTAGRHLHDGVTYCGYAHTGGLCDNTCRALCTLEDCDTAGRHLHDGVTYCGYDHACGFCDGSCALYAVRGHGHGRCHG